MNTQRVLATFMAAVLIVSVFSVVGMISTPKMANAQAVTIRTSADGLGGTFFGEGMLQVIIEDPTADDDSSDTIDVQVDLDSSDGSTTETITIDDTSNGSQRFEFFLVHTDASDLTPNDPIRNSALDDDHILEFGDGAGADELDVSGLQLFEDASFDIRVGNVEITVDYEEATGQLTIDRETYGTDSLMYIVIFDNDANLDPTGRNNFNVTVADLNGNLTDSDRELFTIDGASFADTVTFEETGDNTAQFEATIQLTDAASGTDDELVFTSEAVELTLHDQAEYTDITGANNDSTDTDQVSFDIDDVDGEFDEIPAISFGSELKLTLRDADRNTDSDDDETILDAVRVSVDGPTAGGLPDLEFLDMEETGDNTGVFTIDLSNSELRITFIGDGQTAIRNNSILELREEDITEDIIVEYTDPADDDSNASVTSLLSLEMNLQNGRVDLPETTGVNDDFTVTITDSDLNDNPRTRDSYSFVLFQEGPHPLRKGTSIFSELATIEIDFEGSAVDFGTQNITYTLVETGINTGVFTVNFDMEDIADHGNNGAALDIDDGDEVEFTYNDLMGTTSRESSDEISVGRASTGVDFSRTTLPIPPEAGSGTAVRIGTIVFTTLIVTDPDSNDLTNAEDNLNFTLGTGNNQFEIEIETDAGTITIDSDADYVGTNIPGTTAQLQDILPSVPSLSETGKATGVFDDELEFRDAAGIDDDDWHNMEITITYHDSDGDEESAGITFRGNDGSVVVDQSSARAGTILTITVEDQDLNLDDAEEEEFNSKTAPTTDFLISIEAEDDDIDQTNTETFRETGPDTGVFVAEFEVGTDITITELPAGEDEIEQATNILITYDDEIDSTGNSGDEIEVNVPVVTSTGAIQITPELVGPGTELTILIIDADLDTDSSGTDDYDSPDPNGDDFFVSFRSDRSEVGDASPNLEETGPNTGVFEFTLELITDEGACQDDDLGENRFEAEGGSQPEIGACPGDLISIRYEDQQDASGRSTTVSQVIEVRSWDPEFVADNESYTVGDRVTITISDPDANRDPDVADSLTDIRVFSTSDAVGEELSALETGKNTGVFRLSFQTSSGTSGGAITVKQGDRVTIEYTDEFPADFEEEEEDKEFQFNVNIQGRTGVDATTPSRPALKDVTGQTLSSLAVGQQAVLSTTVVNNNDEPRPFVALVEVRDSDGITVFLAWQTGTLNPNGQSEVGLSWTPEDAGSYEVRTFVISDLQNPQILSQIATSNINVSG